MPDSKNNDSSASFIDGATLAGLLDAVRSQRPLVHHITNSVTVNDCANITICAGAAPVWPTPPVAEMVTAASALVLNIGTLSRTVDAMFIGPPGKRPRHSSHPHPIGVRGDPFRTETAWRLLDSLGSLF